MRARVIRGKIRVRLEDPDEQVWLRQREQIQNMIGSAHPVGDDIPEVSCMASPHNFRKLRQMGCKLNRDDATMAAVKKMREDRDVYDAESRAGAAAKESTAPIGAYEFKKPPYAHQVPGFNFLHAMRSPALFGDCGTGKTYMVLTFADSLIRRGEKWVFLVVCPVNLITHVWIADAEDFTDLKCVGLREDSVTSVLGEDLDEKDDPDWDLRTRDGIQQRAALRAKRREDPAWKAKAKRRAQARQRKKLKERFAQDADIYVINPENLRADAKEKRVKELCRRKLKEGYKICLVIDESSKLKSRVSRTYRALKRIRSFCERCIIMTGTPSPNGILDLWAQFSVLDGGQTLQPSFTDYRHQFAEEFILRHVTWEDKQGNKHNATKWRPKPGAAIQVYQTLEPRMIRFRTEDCIDLPPKRFLVREIAMSEKQTTTYTEMQERLFTELEGEPVTAKVAAVKLLKLRQITGGFLRTDDEKEIPLDKETPKMVELDELLEQAIADKIGDDGPPNKALIWAQYRWECRTLVKRYAKKYGAKGLFGGISSRAKDAAITRFKRDDSARVLVCHPGSVGHGLTLTEANFVFYYSLSYNFEEFYQSFRRITRPGQKRNMTFYFLVCPNTIDWELVDVVREKKNLSDLITDGRFSRDEFLARRKKSTNQIDMNWEVPHDQTAGPSAEEGR
jgi:SNF2 family DNA or RNA helicase